MTKVEEFLTKNNIKYFLHKHPPVFTCEDADLHCRHIAGIASKNLFLINGKKTRFFLFVLPASKRADLKQIKKLLNENKISFASPEFLKEKLNLTPGSVSPFGLLNDKNNEVELYLDAEINNANIVSFHPNENTATLELTNKEFKRYLNLINKKPNIINI